MRNKTGRHMSLYDAFVLLQICDWGSSRLFMSTGLVLSLSLFLSLPSFSPTPPLWSGPPSRCEVEWLASRLWSGCAWIKVVTEQWGGWQMPQPESFSIRLPFQATAKVKHFTGRWRRKKKKTLNLTVTCTHTHTHTHTHTYCMHASPHVHRPTLILLISQGVTLYVSKRRRRRERVMTVKVNGFLMQHLCLLSCLLCPLLNEQGQRVPFISSAALIRFKWLARK